MKLVLTKDGLYEAPASDLTPHRLDLGRAALSNMLKKDSKLARFMNITPVSAEEKANSEGQMTAAVGSPML